MLWRETSSVPSFPAPHFLFLFFFGPSNAVAATGDKTGSKSMAADGVREELSGSEYALKERRARDEMCIDRERDGHKNR